MNFVFVNAMFGTTAATIIWIQMESHYNCSLETHRSLKRE
ncbi:rCG59264 [Rattus norvegicus]|uniref:RCG59264 n=1 Tax=Rattus norvegicus TaxID=10116 RepID=A6K7U1_RAT|nr:rCG59264 [Rattus norvegicus]